MSTQPPASEIPSDKNSSLHGLRILMVEDDEAVRETQRRLLESDQHMAVVGEVSSGEEALKFLEISKVDIVTTDLLLPGMSGIDNITQIKAQFPAVKGCGPKRLRRRPHGAKCPGSGGHLCPEALRFKYAS